MPQIYIFSHDLAELRLLTYTFQQIDWNVLSWSNENELLQELEVMPSQMILLSLVDVDSPLVKLLREMTIVPIVIISDYLAEKQHIDLLEQGVDIIITRPYSMRVLQSQISALLRRSTGVPITLLPEIGIETELIIDNKTYTVNVPQIGIQKLSKLEFSLLYLLMTHAEQIMPANVLVERVWGYAGEGSVDLVRRLVYRVRKKIEKDPSKPQFIITVPSIGYKFQP
ncbi:MAG TPA: response regulator transcription factor [Anaerolineae bacterium]|nr:response regulator transcription factor [Anaerolineae bacterium]